MDVHMGPLLKLYDDVLHGKKWRGILGDITKLKSK